MEGDTEKRAAIFIGPEFGTVHRANLVAAAREAGDGAFDVLIACAFNYEAHTSSASWAASPCSRPARTPTCTWQDAECCEAPQQRQTA
jgi:hypothetical protein